MTVRAATAESVGSEELAAVAAQTFPLACPPSVSAENIASFIAANLSAGCFAGYLADPGRLIFTAQHRRRIIGYAMLIRGLVPDADMDADMDADIARVLRIRPAVELSKMYVLPDYHGRGVSTALMDAVLAGAAEWAARWVWLGVNQQNRRAQRFYAKHGFTACGTRRFRLGSDVENDYLMIRVLDPAG
ncbi:GNAT family N-acetyltransferase [Mycobacterium sp. SM1]|uniref:GNAT family N-acetyltransferase n=1 Tax=Mycobacterium sp. SM1 TaxID=2816243 RepID=UPI001BCEB3B9|nr:GNAT family N-acetyltransferase [Mycobacterium sp. SM1]MBS4730042.1 GNAT family N-acetyltransferase [Mycobacterium sp. SM1]